MMTPDAVAARLNDAIWNTLAGLPVDAEMVHQAIMRELPNLVAEGLAECEGYDEDGYPVEDDE